VSPVRVMSEIPGVQSLSAAHAKGKFVVLNVAIRNADHSPLDSGASLDGRTLLLVGRDTFSHVLKAEELLPGELDAVGHSIQPGSTEQRHMVYDVSTEDLSSKRIALIHRKPNAQRRQRRDHGLDCRLGTCAAAVG
jgi:hypothetical protein